MVPDEPIEDPFEYVPIENLYSRALRDVVDRRLERPKREGASRAIAFALKQCVVTEAIATDVLTAIWKSVDVSKVVRTLLLGLLDADGEHERVEQWTGFVADRALAEGHVPSFLSAMRILVGLRDYDGAVRTSWQVALIQTLETTDLRLRRRVFLLANEYGRPHHASDRRSPSLMISCGSSGRPRGDRRRGGHGWTAPWKPRAPAVRARAPSVV